MSFYYSASLQSHTFEKMSEHYDSLLESGLQSDVILVAGYKEFRVHKAILSARSPVFAAMFAHSSTKEAQENRVEIVDVYWEVLESFVRYIYTGKVESLDQFAGDLLVAADKYQLASLKSICEKHLWSGSVEITTENASDLLFLADMYQINTLATKCLDYIVHNGTQVIANEGWEKIRVKAHLLEKLFEISSAKFSKVFDRGDRYGKIKKKYIARQNRIIPFDMASFESNIFEELSQNYESLLKSELFSDVVLVAGGKELKVHKVILSARSPIFAEMFTNELRTKEVQENRFEITEMDVDVLERLVQYTYTGKVETPNCNAAVDLFLAAKTYQLNCLKWICENRLMHQITAESICDLTFADMHSATNLFTKCLDNFIGFGTKVMVSKEDWEKKIVTRTDLLAKLFVRLILKYSRLVESVYYREKKIESKKEDEDYSGVDWTVRPDLDFEMDLLKYANFIICKEEMTEVILVVGDAELRVHKQVLSAGSSVFAAIFYSHDPTEKEAKKNRLVITDLDMEVLKVLVKYIYTGRVEQLDHNAIGKLFVAAHKYQVDNFKSVCVQQLLSQMTTIESVLNLLILADTYQITELYSKCLVYITENCAQVVASVGWKKLVAKADLFAKICGSLNLNFSEQLLLCSITTETVSNLLILACKHQVAALITKCVDYITDNGTEVIQQEDWKKIVARGDLLVKLLECLSLKYRKVMNDLEDVHGFYNDSEYERDYDYENDNF